MIDLSSLHSFAFNYKAQDRLTFSCADALLQAAKETQLFETPHLILGEGTNTVFVNDFNGRIISMDNDEIRLSGEDKDYFYVTAESGVNWHSMVEFTMNNQLFGLENLALIPGSVGAAPIQNIGAYGLEFADVCHQVEYLDKTTLTLVTLDCEHLQLSYRDSIFKRQLNHQAVITKVVLRLKKRWQPINQYHGLQGLQTPQEIFDAVIKERKRKLPEYRQIPNAGSFFKNPVLPKEQLNALKAEFDAMPIYPVDEDYGKTSAAWLIEQCGLKGKTIGNVGVYDKHALILVNLGQGKGEQLLELIDLIKSQVKSRFEVDLATEVQVI